MNHKIKQIILPFYKRLEVYLPSLSFVIQYRRAIRKLGNLAEERKLSFDLLVKESANKLCLQIGVKDSVGRKYGANWVSVDKYDMREFIDHHYDIHDLQFDDNSFDVAVCISILEHIPYPDRAIAELYRVLKPGGKIWVQLPFNFPYHEAPKDYWRVSPDGLRMWMKDFKEILCGSFLFTRTSLVTSTFFYGIKPLHSNHSAYGSR